MKNRFISYIAAAALLIGSCVDFEPANAQVYPTASPSYTPNAELSPAVTFTAPGTEVFTVNGVGALKIGVTGTNTGVVAEVDCSVDRTNWYALKLQPDPSGTQVIAIAADGNWIVPAAGCRLVRFNLTAISTGSVVAKMIGGIGGITYVENPLQYKERPTYTAAVVGLVPAASATDIFTIAGSATKTIRVTKLCVSGRATAVAGADIVLVKRSVADTSGTSTAPTAVPNDANDAASVAILAAYTVNPTLGTAIGNIGSKQVFLGNLTTGAGGSQACWTYTDHAAREITLRGVASQLAVNLNGVTYSGNLLDVELEWVEE